MSSCNCSCLHKHKSESRTCFLDLTKTQKYSQKTSCSMWLDAALAQHHLAATVTSTRGFTPLTGTDKQATSFLLIQDSNSFVQLKGPYPTSHTRRPNPSPGVTAVEGSTAMQRVNLNRGISALPTWPQPRSSQSTAAKLCHLLRTDTGTPQKIQEFPLVAAERGGKA